MMSQNVEDDVLDVCKSEAVWADWAGVFLVVSTTTWLFFYFYFFNHKSEQSEGEEDCRRTHRQQQKSISAPNKSLCHLDLKQTQKGKNNLTIRGWKCSDLERRGVTVLGARRSARHKVIYAT